MGGEGRQQEVVGGADPPWGSEGRSWPPAVGRGRVGRRENHELMSQILLLSVICVWMSVCHWVVLLPHDAVAWAMEGREAFRKSEFWWVERDEGALGSCLQGVLPGYRLAGAPP